VDFIALEPQLISLNIDNAYTVLHNKYAKDDEIEVLVTRI